MRSNILLIFMLGAISVMFAPRGKKMPSPRYSQTLKGTNTMSEPDNLEQYQGENKIKVKISLVDTPKEYCVFIQEVGKNAKFEVCRPTGNKVFVLEVYSNLVDRLSKTELYAVTEEGTTNGLGRFIVFQLKEDVKLWEEQS